MAEERLYFAYGSNINLDQMAHRCPDAQVVGPVVLENYKLLFRGNTHGNGVATIRPHKGREVHGLLWKITPECERALDVYEGFPRLYDKQDVTVRDRSGREITVTAYVMTDLCKEPAMPSDHYYNGILEGYRQNGLPVVALKKAWDHVVREVHRETERINAKCVAYVKRQKGHGRHER